MNRHFFLVGIRKIHLNALILYDSERSGLGSQPPLPQNAL